MTNNHVVEGADIIKVTLQNDKEYEAKLIGSDPKTDIASDKNISKIMEKKKSFSFLTMGDSEKISM